MTQKTKQFVQKTPTKNYDDGTSLRHQVSTSFRLHPHLKEKIRENAEIDGVSMNYYINLILSEKFNIDIG